ncbi:hypothetical protein [Rhizobium sp. AAP43]|uniref:hypothetical protein n=1 Tax=Rhizobium sp. AAP43 TaxID=1523420 RepID=UPI0006B9C762|nr:hypothetical protein [Rhizobium sp. AAP43]KPF42996.1 hypothetical protein IP76_14455 [Rhizobium sp. AAP43]
MNDNIPSEFRASFFADRSRDWIELFHKVQKEHEIDIRAWADAFLDFHPVEHQRTAEAVKAWSDLLPWSPDYEGEEQARTAVRMSIAMQLAHGRDRHLTPLQLYRLQRPTDTDEVTSMDLAKQIEIECRPFLDPDLQLDGTDMELAEIRRKLLAVDQAIGRHHEVRFRLRRNGYEVAIDTQLASTVDEIKRDAIVAEIEMIMRGEQL